MKRFYITTAIDYANGSPHMGHAYEKVLTDVTARFRRLQGDAVHFLTGLDEHGQKVQKRAQSEGVAPQAFCDSVATEFQHLWEQLSVSYDDFIRTTEPRHRKVVQTILRELYDKGEIYKSDYTGFYSPRAEQFLQEKDKVDGKWPEAFGEVVEIAETNYFFRLSRYQAWLVNFLKNHPNFIFPRFRLKQVIEFLREPINDLCISRPRERLAWGIPLPFDTDYVTYVWFDALVNYISAVGYGTAHFQTFWPADYHVIGKDILSPPHAIYWPIMLKACGVELPKHLLVHGWWLKAGTKMAKSTGNLVNPLSLIRAYGPDPFRYFVIREMNVGQDSEFCLEQFARRYEYDLANDLGNLVSRFLNMVERYCEGITPVVSIEDEPEQKVKHLWAETRVKVVELYEGFQFHMALEQSLAFIKVLNQYAEIRAPWKLAKSSAATDRNHLESCLGTLAEGLRLGATLLMPVMPQIVQTIYNLFAVETPQTWAEWLNWGKRLEGRRLGKKVILFPKIEKDALRP